MIVEPEEELTQSVESEKEPLFHIVLYQPEIPNNTGSIGRTCVGIGAKLWLVRPFGFQITDRKLRRAGLDYWPHLDWEAVDNWEHLLRRIGEESGRFGRHPNFWFFSKKATRLYYDPSFQQGDVFVYGKESVGLPEDFLTQQGDHALRIPITEEIRSLNQSVSVGITVFEAIRQLATR